MASYTASRVRWFRMLLIRTLGLVILCLAPQAYTVLAVCPVVNGYDVGQDDQWIRVGTTNMKIQFKTDAGKLLFFGGGDNCGIDAHRTHVKALSPCIAAPAKEQRFFTHVHSTYQAQLNAGNCVGLDPKGKAQVVTQANIHAYFEDYYGHLSPDWQGGTFTADNGATGVDVTKNCWAYAMGYDMWIQDPDIPRTVDWLADPWFMVGNILAFDDAGQTPRNYHMSKITAVGGPGTYSLNYVTQTKEKFQSSDIYTGSKYSGKTPYNDFMNDSRVLMKRY